MVEAEAVFVGGCGGGGVQFGFQDDDLEPDVAAWALEGAEDGLGGFLLVGGTAGDDGGEQLLGGGRVAGLAPVEGQQQAPLVHCRVPA